jgi:hypothetical protein
MLFGQHPSETYRPSEGQLEDRAARADTFVNGHVDRVDMPLIPQRDIGQSHMKGLDWLAALAQLTLDTSFRSNR